MFAHERSLVQKYEGKPFVLLGVNADDTMHWRGYALALVAFNALGAFFVYGLQRLQGVLPFNAAGLGAVETVSCCLRITSFVSGIKDAEPPLTANSSVLAAENWFGTRSYRRPLEAARGGRSRTGARR